MWWCTISSLFFIEYTAPLSLTSIPLAVIIRGANKEDTLPLMKLKKSHPLSSRASHWPPVSSRGGNSDGGEGYGFSVTVCTQRGLNLGLEQLGFFMAQTWPDSDPESVRVWPRFSPDLAQINTITCMCPSWLATEHRACRGSVAVGGKGVIWGAMHDQPGAQTSMRVKVEELNGVKGHRKKKRVVTNSKQILFV